MDPVCHTLVGAALGRAGLARRSSLGMAALIAGANLPDIDVVAYLGGPSADLAFRRGWTHGVLALAVLPALLTAALLAIHRFYRRVSGASLPSSARPSSILLLSYIATLTHPVLDTMNTYGVRWLMPFSERWFYGDTLFIVDPWVLLALGAGLYFGRKRRAKSGFRVYPMQPPRIALLAVTVYVAVMALSGRIAESMLAREMRRWGGPAVEDIMVSPRPITPAARHVVVVRGDWYLTGEFRWFRSPHLVRETVRQFPRGYPEDPDVRRALQATAARRFLEWSRFPTFQTRMLADGTRVVDAIDLRYVTAPGGFGTVTVPVTPSISSRSAGSPPASF